MPSNETTQPSELQAAGRLSIEAIVGITDIVESMHQTIASAGGVLGSTDKERTKGLTGLVYASIRGVTRLVGKGLDLPLQRLGNLLDQAEPPLAKEAVSAALNGILGDYLAQQNNPLGVSMSWRLDGRNLSEEELRDLIEQTKGKLLILVHGLCMNDLQWQRNDHEHAKHLAEELGSTRIYLHYNSGRHISENGREFSEKLDALVALSSKPLDLVILAHSMGGLVSRSACYYASQNGDTETNSAWLDQLQHMIFLGTPHHGAPLEKGGNYLENIFKFSPYSAPFAKLARVRSAGITDLRYGNIVDEDWHGSDPHHLNGDKRTAVPLPAHVESYAVAATINKANAKIAMGDGLVMLNSALGKHKNPLYDLNIPEENQLVCCETNHMDLLDSNEVYEQMKNWLSTD